jgi:hypothetical protein
MVFQPRSNAALSERFRLAVGQIAKLLELDLLLLSGHGLLALGSLCKPVSCRNSPHGHRWQHSRR